VTAPKRTPKELVDAIVRGLHEAGGSEHDVRLSAKNALETPVELVEYLLRLPGARWMPYRAARAGYGWVGVLVDSIHFSVHDVPADQAALARRRGAA